MEALDGRAPAAAGHEVVPVGDDVPERAALVAEGDAAVHAARALALEHLVGRPLLELPPVLQALRDRLLVDLLALELEEAGDLPHRQIEARRAASVSRCCLASTWRYLTGITLTTFLMFSFQTESELQ